MLKIRASSTENLEGIHREIKGMEEVASVKLLFALKEVKMKHLKSPKKLMSR